MTNLQRLSLDWFGYLCPPRKTTIQRHADGDDIDVESNQWEFEQLAELLNKDYQVEFLSFAKHFGVQNFNETDAKGRTILHYCAQKGDVYLVNALLRIGVNTNIKDHYQFSAYGFAMREEQFETADVLLDEN